MPDNLQVIVEGEKATINVGDSFTKEELEKRGCSYTTTFSYHFFECDGHLIGTDLKDGRYQVKVIFPNPNKN